MSKRTIACLLAAIMMLCTFFACSQKDNSSSAAPAVPANSAAQAQEASTTATDAPKETSQEAEAFVPTPPKSMIISSGPSGGNFYAQGVSFSDLFTRNGCRTDSIPGGGAANILAVQNGQAELGYVAMPILSDAIQHKNSFAEETTVFDDVVVYCAFATSPVHMFVHGNIEANSLEDFKGLKVCGPQAGSSSQEIAFACFEAAGLDPEKDFADYRRGSMSEQAELFKDRVVDAMIISTGIGNSTMVDILTSVKDVKVIPMSDASLEALKVINPGYNTVTIPAGAYPGLDKDIQTVGSTACMFGTKSRLTDSEAYWVTKMIVENWDYLVSIHSWFSEVTIESMSDAGALEMHPGAVKFYQDYFAGTVK